MLHLANRELALNLLDPADPADAARLGPRFCAGGFLWQVHDLAAGPAPLPLVTGPEWPSPTPLPFNAQGLPESFRHRTRDGAPLTVNGALGLAIGAGALAVSPSGEATLTAPCRWEITPAADHVVFHTRQAAAGFAYDLTRRIGLHGRIINSTTQLTNLAAAPLALEWFAHPFWALGAGRARLALPPGTTVPDNPGFAVAADGTLTFRRPFVAPDDSQFSLLALPPGQPLALSLDHPALARVTFATSFVPSECPVWANARTVSVEPYLALRLAPGETREWSVVHGFER
ncbi:MAG: hypothetical protein NTV51_26365 [Verrucomicrobia bacterium]|nr:hypothetical protein [Verrucomicrobiota bacterium]